MSREDADHRHLLHAIALRCCAWRPPPAPRPSAQQVREAACSQLVNKERAKHGTSRSCRCNGNLVNAARAHSADMGEQQYFAHDSPTASTWSRASSADGYTARAISYWRAGENIS